MFKSARIRLTAWYSLIIMIVSLCFSAAIYQGLTRELARIERVQQFRVQRQIFDQDIDSGLRRSPLLDPEIIQETRQRLILFLGTINLAILGISAAAGYFLAGRTLKPIKLMVEAQNRFISDASHELRTPLTAMKAEIEVNLRDKRLTKVQAGNILASNLEEVNKLQLLSDSLIKLTRFDAKNNGMVKKPTDIKPTLAEAINNVAILAKNKQITLKSKLNSVQVNGNAASLTELWTIILDNAIKYSLKKTTVMITTKTEEKQAWVQIKDQGIGISPEDLPHIFERFYRADASRTKMDINGYGLGLSIAQQIVSDHHGKITATSKLGSGTTFRITLPILS